MMHIWRDCGHWGEPCPCCAKAEAVTTTPLQVQIPKRKKKPTYRFAVWLKEDTKEPDAQIPFKPWKKKVYCRAQHSWLDVESADWVSTASYSKAFEYEDTGIIGEDGKPLKRRRIGKQAENLREIYWIILDFDNPDLTEDLIRQRLHYHNLPEPTYIIRNPLSGKYQAFWIFPIPLGASYSGWWQSVANRLFQVFNACEEDKKLFCCDPKVLNPSWYARNPYNPKYEKVHKGSKVSLGEIDRALKEARFLPSSRKTPNHATVERILFFLNSHNGIITTYEELFSQCKVAISTGHEKIAELEACGKLETEKIRVLIVTKKGKVCSTWKTKFTLLKKSIKEETPQEKVSDSHTPDKDYLKLFLGCFCVESWAVEFESVVSEAMREVILKVIGRIRVVGFPFRWRNKGVFMLSLGLKLCGFSESVVLECLALGFSKSRCVGDHEFSRKEFMQTVENAFKPKYRYCVGYRNEEWNWEGFLNAIEGLERGNVIELESVRKEKLKRQKRL